MSVQHRISAMTQRVLDRIQFAILTGDYDLTRHAIEEMAEDGLGILDVECAVLNGRITKTEADDPRGPRSTVVGSAKDARTDVGIVGRFTEIGGYLIITVYEVAQLERW